MPKFHRPVILRCSINDEKGGRCLAYMAPNMPRSLVRGFLEESGNRQWRTESLTREERLDCGVPDLAVTVSFPVHQKDWFYQAYDEFVALLYGEARHVLNQPVPAST